jgi:ribosomal protein L7/L12
MNIQHKIEISRYDFFQILNHRGINVPADSAVVSMAEDGFPIEVSWVAPAGIQFAIGYRFERAKQDVLESLIKNEMKIQAIKLIREWTGWGLKESKEWTDQF